MERTAVYEVRVLLEVKEVLDRLADDIFYPLSRDIDSLAYAPRREDAEELAEGFWVLRSAGYAIIYSIVEDRLVVVLVRVGRQAEILAEGS